MSEIIFVTVMGIGTVFVGLICIVFLCKILSAICNAFIKEEKKAAPAPAKAAAPAPIADRKKIVAAVSAVIAEELGEDVSAIRIKSFKKI